MRFASRRLVLAVAVALPLAVAVASFAITDDVTPPNVPARVQVGESLDPSAVVDPSTGSRPPSTSPDPDRPSRTPSRKRPQATAEVVPPPPIQGGGDDDDDGGDDD